jgi:hypothetical protein
MRSRLLHSPAGAFQKWHDHASFQHPPALQLRQARQMKYVCPFCYKTMPSGYEPSGWTCCGEVGHATLVPECPKCGAEDISDLSHPGSLALPECICFSKRLDEIVKEACWQTCGNNLVADSDDVKRAIRIAIKEFSKMQQDNIARAAIKKATE